MLFPWLYPGGNWDTIDISVKEWSSQQLCMNNGRFAMDKKCCFCALNYDKHRRHQVQGQWFVNNLLHSKGILDIDTLM
jgi:hypothetical protein